MNGLNAEQIAAVTAHFSGTYPCEVAATDDGARYVSMTVDEERGIYRSISRYDGKLIMMDQEGRVLAEGKSLEFDRCPCMDGPERMRCCPPVRTVA